MDDPNKVNRDLSLEVLTQEQLAKYEGFPKRSELEQVTPESSNYQEALYLISLHKRKEELLNGLNNLETTNSLDDFMNDTTRASTELLLELGETTAKIWFHDKSPEVIKEMQEILQRELDLCDDGSSYARDEKIFDGVYYDFNSSMLIKLRSLFRFSGIIDRKSAELRYTDLSKTYTLKKNLGKFIEGMMKHISTLV